MRIYHDGQMFDISNIEDRTITIGDIVIIDSNSMSSEYSDPLFQLARLVTIKYDGTCNVVLCKSGKRINIPIRYILGKANEECTDIGKRLEENRYL